MSVSPVAQHLGAGVRSLTPIHLVSLCFLACGMRLYTCNLFKMLSWLQQFKFRSFGRTVIQFGNTTAVYSKVYVAISRAMSNVSVIFWRLSI